MCFTQCLGPVSKEFCLRDTAASANQTTNDNEQNVASSIAIPKPSCAPSLNEETTKGVTQCVEEDDSPVSALRSTAQPLSSHVHCTDILDSNDIMEDDGDDELPTFDVFSSLGIEPI